MYGKAQLYDIWIFSPFLLSSLEIETVKHISLNTQRKGKTNYCWITKYEPSILYHLQLAVGWLACNIYPFINFFHIARYPADVGDFKIHDQGSLESPEWMNFRKTPNGHLLKGKNLQQSFLYRIFSRIFHQDLENEETQLSHLQSHILF